MKKLYILTLIMIFGLGSFAINLTFRVDMSEQTVSPDGVHIAGSFQGWDPAGTEMTNTGNDVFAVTLSITSGEYIQYKFINGIDWTQAELVPEACGVDDGYGGFNRFLTVPQEDTTLTAVCFGSCNPCGYYVEPLISDNWRTHHWPYNAYYPLCSNPNHNHGIVNGRVACSCGPTAVSRLLHYWEFPVQGNGSFSYTDVYGCQYSADFGNTIYEWDKMPYALYESDPENVYAATATLTYHVATCVNDVNVTGASVEMWITGLTSYLRYSSTAEYVIRSNYTKEEWINIYKTELDNGRPVLVVGGNTGGGGHWFICDGYNEADEFHFIMGWGGNGDDYYDIDDPNGYSLNNKALIKLQPELNGKELALVSPNGGEVLPAGEETDITWDSENVSDIKIDYTLDNGYNWQEIIGSTSASTGFFTWTVPNTTSDQCKVKLTDVTDINVYDKSDDVFSIQSYGLTLISPNGGEYYIQGITTSITWENTSVSDIEIEYTTDNGSNWIEITASTSAASGSYDWIIPNVISDQCKVKITDITNNTIYDESDNVFEIAEETSHALQFDGFNDYIEVNNMPFPVDDFTIEAWISSGDFIDFQYIVAGYGPNSGAQFRVNPDGSLLYGEYSPWSYVESEANSILPNVWTHIAVTKQGNDCNLFINGLNAAYNQFDINPVTSELHIGCRGVNMDGFFNGDIDEVRMWTIARTQTEIQENMNTYLDGSEYGLIGYWRMNEGSGQTAYDLSGHGNDGQLGSTPGIDSNDPTWIATDWPYGITLQADFSATPISGNAPLTVNFTDLSTGNPTSWEWDFENDGTIDSYVQNPEWIYYEPGTYTISLNVSDGTNTDTEIKTDFITVFILPGEPSNPSPEAGATNISIYTNLNWVNGNNTETIDLYFDTINPPADLVLNNVTAVNFYDPDDLNTETTYYWQVICRNPVGFTEGQVWSFTTEPGTGIFNNQIVNELFTLYPNPASGKLYLKTINLESRQIFVEILNINGKVVYSKTISTNTIVPIDTDNLKKGIYFIQLRNEKYLQTKKLIIK